MARTCPRCARPAPHVAHFCRRCGYPLRHPHPLPVFPLERTVKLAVLAGVLGLGSVLWQAPRQHLQSPPVRRTYRYHDATPSHFYQTPCRSTGRDRERSAGLYGPAVGRPRDYRPAYLESEESGPGRGR